MTDTEALKPCPFCNAQPGVEINGTDGYSVVTVVCSCGARAKPFVRKQGEYGNLGKVYAAWNTRAGEQA